MTLRVRPTGGMFEDGTVEPQPGDRIVPEEIHRWLVEAGVLETTDEGTTWRWSQVAPATESYADDFLRGFTLPDVEVLTDRDVANECERAANTVLGEARLLDSIAARLRRANGGPFRECTWCNKEGVHERPDGQLACDAHEEMPA